MNHEELKINWRMKNTAEHLLNPLYRGLEEAKLRWVYQSMDIKLNEAKLKNPNADYSEAQSKIDSLIENSEYQRFLFELAYQCNLAAFRAEQRSLEYLNKVTDLQLEIKSLKEQLEFVTN